MTDESPADFAGVGDAWYNASINAVVSEGLMNGYPDGSFQPNAPISRAEFVAVLSKLTPANDAVAPYRDIEGHWAQEAIHQAFGNQLLAGYADGTFRPGASITRAEAVTLLNRHYDRHAVEASLDDVKADIKKATDVSSDHWAYYELIEASHSHDYTLVEENGTTYEAWLRVA